MTLKSTFRPAIRFGLKVLGALAFLAPLATRLVMGQAFFLTGRGKLENFPNDHRGRATAVGRGHAPREELEALGPLSLRPAVGNGARGLLAGRRRLGVPSARSRAQPCLPLG